MRRSVSFLIALCAVVALAQNDASESRIIRIESEGASVSGNIRYGPLQYEHPDPEGIRATVSNLTIFASAATLQVPEEEQGETYINQATGRREATFSGGVRVVRDRLTALGPALVYRESTGLGTLAGGGPEAVGASAEDDGADEEGWGDEAEDEPAGDEAGAQVGQSVGGPQGGNVVGVTIEPDQEGDEPVFIEAQSVEFDVDTDRSVSRGSVQLQNGSQTATTDELTFEETRNLGVLRTAEGQSVVTRESEDGTLTIAADEIRILTDGGRVYATGNVTVVDGTITSSGHTVFFDDEASLAEVLGSPAISVDEANGVRLESPRIQQDIEYDFVEALDASAPQPFSPDDFLLQEERPAGS